MYQAIFVIYRKEGWTRERFMDYWVNTHMPIAKQVTQIRGYTVFPTIGVTGELGEPADGFVLLTFDSKEHFHQVLRSEEFRPALADGDVFTRHVERYTVDKHVGIPLGV
ncbi:MAG TPA: EthD family reductase [Solirubrobacteraceae bacterium]|jgi:uncharacterized protein (TIGR02118 family)|nr:EthD family reductase [Solirubrobacteraceae bacterium]